MAYLVISINHTYAQQNLSAIQDSFDLLIQEAVDDSSRIRDYKNFLRHPSIKDVSVLNQYYDKAHKLSSRFDDKKPMFHFAIIYATKLAKLGLYDLSSQKFAYIIDNPESISYPWCLGQALCGLSRLRSDEGDTESAKQLAVEAISVLRNTDYHDARCQAYIELTLLYRNAGLLDKAVIYSDSSIMIGLHTDNTETLSGAYVMRGRIYRMLGDNNKAKESYLSAEAILSKNGNSSNLSSVWNNLGNMGHIAGDYEEAIAYYMKSLAIKEKNNDNRGICISYHNIAAIKLDMKDWEGAITDFNKSRSIATEIGFQSLIVYNDNKLGAVNYQIEDYPQSLEYYQAALSLSKEINFVVGEMTAMLGIGRVYMAMTNYIDATQIFIDGLALSKLNKNKSLESSFLVSLAEVYRQSKQSEISENIIKESSALSYIEIEELLTQAKSLADEMNNADNKIESLNALHLFYADAKRYYEDAKVLSEYAALKDSLFSEQRAEAIAEWETKYSTAEKEKEILALEAKNKIAELENKQFRSMLIGSVSFFILSLLFGYYYLRQKSNKRQAKQREAFRSKLSSDLHDDVGSILTGLAMQSELLSNFADDSLKISMDKMASMSRDAMTRMRDTVWAIDSRKDTYADLVDRMLDFGNEILSTKNITLKLNTDIDQVKSKINPEIRQNIFLIYKEALTNVAKYSTANIVEVSLQKYKSELILNIQDNGVVDPLTVRTSGVGTASMKSRAESLNGDTEIDYSNIGCRVTSRIPIV